MFKHITIAVILFSLSVVVFAQQMPGRWDQNKEYSIKQFPGEIKSELDYRDEEVTRLNKLVEQLNKKISLLEKKVLLLETELKNSKNPTPEAPDLN